MAKGTKRDGRAPAPAVRPAEATNTLGFCRLIELIVGIMRDVGLYASSDFGGAGIGFSSITTFQLGSLPSNPV